MTFITAAVSVAVDVVLAATVVTCIAGVAVDPMMVDAG